MGTKVEVVDENGEPIVGVMVKLKKDMYRNQGTGMLVFPHEPVGKTDENGIAKLE